MNSKRAIGCRQWSCPLWIKPVCSCAEISMLGNVDFLLPFRNFSSGNNDKKGVCISTVWKKSQGQDVTFSLFKLSVSILKKIMGFVWFVVTSSDMEQLHWDQNCSMFSECGAEVRNSNRCCYWMEYICEYVCLYTFLYTYVCMHMKCFKNKQSLTSIEITYILERKALDSEIWMVKNMCIFSIWNELTWGQVQGTPSC